MGTATKDGTLMMVPQEQVANIGKSGRGRRSGKRKERKR